MLSTLVKNFTKYWDDYWKATAEYTGKGLHLLSIRENIKNSNIYKLKCRRYEKVIFRLRIGHVGLRQQLHRIGLVNSELCEHCNEQEKETINHYIFYCTAFNCQRKIMMDKLKGLSVTDVTLKILLGGEGKYNHISKEILMTVIEYIISTNRLADI